MLGILPQKICKEVIFLKKFFAFFIIVSLILCAFSFTVTAQGTVYEYYKSQLNADEQKVYEAFITAAKSSDGRCEIPKLSTVQYDFVSPTNIADGSQLNEFINNDPQCQTAMSKIKEYFSNALYAVITDHPELYWLDNQELGGVSFQNSSYGKNVSIKAIATIPASVCQANANQSIKEVDLKLQSIGATGTDIEKVKKIHDWLCDNVKYVDGNHAHDLYGSLFLGKAVCQGYAEAFKAACDYYGIKCVCVEGEALNSQGVREAHMWNYVLINNTWYAVDVTWDDQDDRILYDYFLAGKNTVATHFDDEKFINSHFANGYLGGVGHKEFKYPELSESGYSLNNPTQKPTAKPVQITPTAKPTVQPTDAPITPQEPTATNAGDNKTPGVESTPTSTDYIKDIQPTETPLDEQGVTENNEDSSLIIILACAGIGIVVVASIIALVLRKKR